MNGAARPLRVCWCHRCSCTQQPPAEGKSPGLLRRAIIELECTGEDLNPLVAPMTLLSSCSPPPSSPLSPSLAHSEPLAVSQAQWVLPTHQMSVSSPSKNCSAFEIQLTCHHLCEATQHSPAESIARFSQQLSAFYL